MRPPFMPRDDDRSPLFFLGAFFMAVLIGLLFLASVVWSSVANAQEPNVATKESKCTSIVQAHTRMEAVASEKGAPFAHRILHGNAAERFMVEFNKLPPESNMVADTVGIFIAAGMPGVFISIQSKGCIVTGGMFPIKTYIELIARSNNERRPT